VEQHLISGKPVFTFEDHATAYVAWSRIRATLERPPFIISFDKHLDTRPAFNSFLGGGFVPDFWLKVKQKLSQIDLSTEASAAETLEHLDNDEHINGAILAEVISFAFVVSPSAGGTDFSPECRHIFEIKPKVGGSLEDEIVAPVYAEIHEVRESVVPSSSQLVLDVDLDFFQSVDALTPRRATCFFELVREAVAITIAEEPTYAAAGVDYRKAKEGLFSLIRRALQ
jgi:hypothetical protein